jgi:betaine-aldehyde dehydrogenase
VQEGIAPRLLERLREEARKITVGDGLTDGVLLGPLVSKGQYDKVVNYVEGAKRAGIELLTGGGRPEALNRGYFLEPTVFVDVPADAPIWTEEVFGPVLAVRTFEQEDEAVGMANDTGYGLAAAVMSRDGERCQRVARAFRAGIVWINCSQPTFSEAPWGGMKRSGIGRELGQWGLDNYLETKQITSYVTEEPWGWYLK